MTLFGFYSITQISSTGESRSILLTLFYKLKPFTLHVQERKDRSRSFTHVPQPTVELEPETLSKSRLCRAAAVSSRWHSGLPAGLPAAHSFGWPDLGPVKSWQAQHYVHRPLTTANSTGSPSDQHWRRQKQTCQVLYPPFPSILPPSQFNDLHTILQGLFVSL